MKNFITWLVTSSADSEKYSLTIKGLLVSIAPIAIIVLHLNTGDYGSLVDAISSVIFYGGSIISAIVTVIGLIRKIDVGHWSAY